MPAPPDHHLVRSFALGLPGAVEQDHHGFPSFRAGGRIFATLPDERHVHIMLDEEDIRMLMRAHANCCEGKRWGKKLAALRVDLAEASRSDLECWLTDAWEQRSGA